ncbi:response regulator transcription factor [Thauera sp. CAU 1555]|jgi:two-component system NarL family response regulator|uniref:Response regulator transcription factor n=1 Tax=Thauera sedimentorum TaxID=2767595 RepID=A0ABR9B901_9RHOO|nr:response regulator transcription factor [Thauera sedimentorum]MBC9071803.1 response regulator transcription factor [Thauera sedimentorum]MBD8502722.1 response regulator transcription factor [Thauera sedimentorum]
MTMRVVLADDHQIFRHALKALLEREGDLQVVGEACNGDELLSVAVREAAELVCIDVAMPGMNGVEATRRLLTLRPDTKVVGLSAFADRQIVLDMLNAGAKGYVTKTEPGEELLRAIRTVVRGRTYLCPEVAEAIKNALCEQSSGNAAGSGRITARERQILQLIAEGHTSGGIAERLHLAVSTVEVHRRNIMRKLDLHSVASLTKFAIRSGLTSATD